MPGHRPFPSVLRTTLEAITLDCQSITKTGKKILTKFPKFC